MQIVGSQEIPGVTGKFRLGVQNEAVQRLIEFRQENALVIANTLFQQHKRQPSHRHHQMVNTEIKLIIFFCSWRWRSSIQSAEVGPRADCGSDHELLIAKLKLKLNKVGRTIRPFRYDLNQIPYDYMVEVINRLKGLDLVDKVLEELWTEVY